VTDKKPRCMARVGAQFLKDARAKLNLSVEELAARAKMEPARIAELESGEHAMFVNEIEPLAVALGIPVMLFIEKLYASSESEAAS
jgi:transcriptional regulator with XRE-family HTH domain